MSRFSALVVALLFAAASFVQAQEISVGTNAEFMPFEFTDDDNNIIGYDIDVINAVGKAVGLEVKMRNQAFDTLVESLETGRIDAVISGMTITDVRKEKVNFSDPYYNAAQVIVVRDGGKVYETMDELKDKRVGVQLGTTGAGMAEQALGESNPNLKQFRKYNEVFNDLKLGRIDAIVVDLPVANAYIKKIPGLKITSAPMSVEEYGIAVKKGNTELLEKINAGLAKIRESGEFDRITEKWFQD